MLVGLLFVRAGFQHADSIAALFVAALVLVAATRLMRTNVDVLMDRVPVEAEAAARAAIAGITPVVDLRRLRMREAGGRQFADVVIGVPAGAAVGQGHAAADRVEEAVQSALPRSDVVVHVEPEEAPGIRDRAQAAALSVGRVREVHNINVLLLDGGTEVSLHLKLPGDLPLEEAHDVAEQVERAIRAAVPSVDARADAPRAADGGRARARGRGRRRGSRRRSADRARGASDASRASCGSCRRREGLVAFLTLGLDPGASLADAHARASEVEARIRDERPEIADVIVHTEP